MSDTEFRATGGSAGCSIRRRSAHPGGTDCRDTGERWRRGVGRARLAVDHYPVQPRPGCIHGRLAGLAGHSAAGAVHTTNFLPVVEEAKCNGCGKCVNACPVEAMINAVPHVRISARAAMTTEGAGSARLSVESTRTTCHAMDAAAARSALESAGNRLRDAIRAVQEPPPIPEDASSLERSFDSHLRYAEVVSAVADLNSAIERAGAACREVPVFSADFGVRGQLTRPESEEDAAPTYLGGSATFHF